MYGKHGRFSFLFLICVVVYNLKDLLKKGMKTEEKNQLSILRFTKKKKKPIFGVGIKLKQLVISGKSRWCYHETIPRPLSTILSFNVRPRYSPIARHHCFLLLLIFCFHSITNLLLLRHRTHHSTPTNTTAAAVTAVDHSPHQTPPYKPLHLFFVCLFVFAVSRYVCPSEFQWSVTVAFAFAFGNKLP
jgi:hypothetical protein